MSLLKNKNYSRFHLRAPLKTFALYEDESYVFKARLMNISEGGILVEQLPHFPKHTDIAIMISLPQYPPFSQMKALEILAYTYDMIEKKIFRGKIQTIRRTQSTTSVDQVFQVGIGGKFLDIESKTKTAITEYVQTFTKNSVYFLNLLEVNANGHANLHLIKHLATLFGYEDNLSLSQIHQRVRHDCQSLELL